MPAHEFMIGPHMVPGLLQGVEVPDRAQVWEVTQGALGGIGASITWRGVKIDEGGIIITTMITDSSGNVVDDADDAARLWGAYLDLIHPESGTKKPPAWDIAHPFIAATRPPIKRAAHSKNKMFLWKEDKLAYIGSLVLIEYKPLKSATPAAPDPAQLDSNTVTPQNKREQYALELVEKVKNG
jgi:hypothetical protein